MLTKRAKLLVSVCVLSQVVLAASKEYDNFSLPPEQMKVVLPENKYSFKSNRVEIKAGKVKVSEPSIDSKLFLLAKQNFLSEKREEVIKILRQQLDMGLKSNRDNLLLKLGQNYAEKYMEMTNLENEVFSAQLQDYERRKLTDKNAKVPKSDSSRSQRYLKDAVKLFYSLEKDYPKHPRLDEVIFFIGFVELESGNDKKGLSYLERVIKNYPNSRKYDEAVVFVGDYYFSNHKFKDAANRYKLLLSHDSGLQDFAHYKLAWCDLNTGEPKKALSTMKSVVERLKGSNQASKFNLRDQALKDMVVFYGEAELVDDAVVYFTQQLSKDKALENLRLLADIYRSKGRDEAAVKAYKKLIQEFPDGLDTPRLYVGLYDSLSRLGKNQEAVKDMLMAFEKYNENSDWAKSFAPEKAADVKATFETLAVEGSKIAYYYHQSGQKSANKSAYDSAVKVYSSLLKNFPHHPEKKKLAYFQGEALYQMGKWLDAANSYMLSAQTPPKDKLGDEAVYNALLSLDHLTINNSKLTKYTKNEQKSMDQKPEEIPEGERRFIEVGEYYLKEYPQGDKVVDVKFRIGSIYYEKYHFDEAQGVFKDIALSHPKHRTATTAAHLVLDIYNIRKDYDGLTSTAVQFAQVKELGDAQFRDELKTIVGEIDFKRIEPLEKDNRWAEAGDTYYGYYKKNPSSALAEKSLYNAYVSFQKSKDAKKSMEVGRLFLVKFPSSTYCEGIMLDIAKLAEKNYDFDQAQKVYLDFQKKFAKSKEAKKALYNAAVYAELLEYNKLALQLYDEYLKTEKVSNEEKKAITISQAKLYRKEGNWDKVTAIYRKLAKESSSESQRVEYLAELGRLYERAGKKKEKESILNEFRVLYEGKKIAQSGGAAAPFVAEAKFKSIEKQKQTFESIKLRFPPEDLVYLLKRKEKALLKLVDQYDSVVSVGVPEWGVAALYEKSQAYANFVVAFRSLQIPKKYKDAERAEVEGSLKAIDAKLVAPLDGKSQEVLKLCLARTADFNVVSDFANLCSAKVVKADTDFEPRGVLPKPVYWSTRPLAKR